MKRRLERLGSSLRMMARRLPLA